MDPRRERKGDNWLNDNVQFTNDLPIFMRLQTPMISLSVAGFRKKFMILCL